jgi:hypothetical protein
MKNNPYLRVRPPKHLPRYFVQYPFNPSVQPIYKVIDKFKPEFSICFRTKNAAHSYAAKENARHNNTVLRLSIARFLRHTYVNFGLIAFATICMISFQVSTGSALTTITLIALCNFLITLIDIIFYEPEVS